MNLDTHSTKLNKIVKSIRKNIKPQNFDFVITDDFAKFNDLIGLPLHPSTMQPMPLMPYQKEFIREIPQERNRLFHINKSRQIGVTELILRVIAFHCFFKYKGGRILILAGTNERIAVEIMKRFKNLFQNSPQTVLDNKNRLKVTLVNGTEIQALTSNSDSIRGETKVRAIFVDEAAHFDLVDDIVVLNAIEPLVGTNKSDLFLVSTPNGRRGFFYEISIGENEYHMKKWDYTNAIGYIYQQDEIEKILQTTTADADQEYRCQFTSSRNSIFGSEFTTEDYEAEEY